MRGEKKAKLKLLQKKVCGKAIGILALKATGGQDFGRRLEKELATEEDQSLFCAHLFWSNIDVSV